MPQDYKVRPGDCINSIAYDHGFFWETLWNEGKNSMLKARRKDPNVLKQGDVVHIPDLRLKVESCAAEKKHKFKLKGVPALFRLRLTEEVLVKSDGQAASPAASEKSASVSDELSVPAAKFETKARAKLPYRLIIDGNIFDGKTDPNGVLEQRIPPNASGGELILEPGTDREVRYELQLGHVDPLSDVVGVKQRLANLGFECYERTDQETPEFAAALRAFQEAFGIPMTGKLDATTRDKVREAHGV